MSLAVQIRVAACGATTPGLAWRRRAHLCDLALLAEHLIGHEARPVRELAKTLVSEARRASLTRARWLARLAQAFGLELAAMLEDTAPVPRPRATADGAYELGAHYCHVPGCQRPTPARLLMCGRHWFRVPPSLRRRVMRAYRAGQEVDKAPTAEWVAAARAAIEAVLRPKRFGSPGLQPRSEASREESP